MPLLDLACLLSDPFLGGGLAFAEKEPGSLPQALKHVDEVDDDNSDAAARGLGGHASNCVLSPSTKMTHFPRCWRPGGPPHSPLALPPRHPGPALAPTRSRGL